MSNYNRKMTEAQIAKAKELRFVKCMTWREVSAEMGILKETIQLALDESRRLKHNERCRHYRRQRQKPTFKRTHIDCGRLEPRNPIYDPMRDGRPVYGSQAAEFLGDPPIGRSALERRA